MLIKDKSLTTGSLSTEGDGGRSKESRIGTSSSIFVHSDFDITGQAFLEIMNDHVKEGWSPVAAGTLARDRIFAIRQEAQNLLKWGQEDNEKSKHMHGDEAEGYRESARICRQRAKEMLASIGFSAQSDPKLDDGETVSVEPEWLD